MESSSIAPDQLVRDLLRPDAYSWRPERVDHLETHISQLFFAGDRVVKIKRPVQYAFVDHRTLEARRQSCEDEVRLNRRLSDDIYLGVEPITLRDGRAVLGGDGEAIEWATVMRRMPAEAMLDWQLEHGRRPERLADRLAERLIPFHRAAGACSGDAAAQAAGAERILRDNYVQIAEHPTPTIFPSEFTAIREVVTGFLDAHPTVIRDRAEGGWIREGHGDLKCEHVALDPPGSLQIYDCVEFNITIRCADVASDLAFLLLDLERLGAGDVAADLVANYRAAGLDLPEEMLTLYRVHRALVRVKTSALTQLHATDPARGVAAARDTAFWLHRATASLFAAAPVAIAMSGFSGTGKSVVARSIADALNAPVLATDVIRREMNQDGARYAPSNRLAVYREMLDRAAGATAQGAVVLDGAFLRSEERELATQVCMERGIPLIFVSVVADPEVVDRRILARAQTPEQTASEATIDVLQAQRAAAALDPVVWPDGATAVTIETSADIPASLDPLLRELRDQSLLSPRLVSTAA